MKMIQCCNMYRTVNCRLQDRSSSCAITIQGYLITSTPTKYTNSTIQHINDNNYVNLYDVTNIGLYNKFILVTQFYIIAIACKTLNGLMVPHTAFPKCITTTTKATTNATTRVHVTKAVIGTRHYFH